MVRVGAPPLGKTPERKSAGTVVGDEVATTEEVVLVPSSPIFTVTNITKHGFREALIKNKKKKQAQRVSWLR